LSIAVEFDGRIAAVAREESNDKYKTSRTIRSSCIWRLFLPTRAYGANSTSRDVNR